MTSKSSIVRSILRFNMSFASFQVYLPPLSKMISVLRALSCAVVWWMSTRRMSTISPRSMSPLCSDMTTSHGYYSHTAHRRVPDVCTVLENHLKHNSLIVQSLSSRRRKLASLLTAARTRLLEIESTVTTASDKQSAYWHSRVHTYTKMQRRLDEIQA